MTVPGTYLQDPTNVVGRRIGAYLIDVVLMGVVVAAIFFGSGANDDIRTREFGSSTEAEAFCDFYDDTVDGVCIHSESDVIVIDEGDVGKVVAATLVPTFLVWLGNWWLLQGIAGGSVGKLLVGLRVVNYDGRRAGIGRSALRTLLLIVDSACLWIPGLVAIFTTKGHRRIGDLAAKTLVVPKAYEGQPIAVPGVTVPAPTFAGSGWPAAPGGGYGAGQPTSPPPGSSGTGWSAPAPPAESQQPSGAELGESPASPTDAAPGDASPVADQGAGAPNTTPSADQPHWDEARRAWLQYDHARGAWLQWDDTAKEWKQI